MDINEITQIVQEQLKANNITDGSINILEKEFGYVIEIKYQMEYMNEIFDKHGNIIYPLGSIHSDSGSIYRTEVIEKVDERGRKHRLVSDLGVRYRQLDGEHFIIPRLDEEGIKNILFNVDKDNNVTYKGYIQGRIDGNILTENKNLLETKQVLSYIDIDEERDEQEYFFYSWDKNCRTSDKWSRIISPENKFYSKDLLMNQMNLPIELVDEIIKYMQSKEAWLATLSLSSKDNQHHMNFVCLIGIDGIPLIDLTYISQTYKVKTISLEKEKIGELDTIKKSLQERMDRAASQIEDNKKNITANFFRTVGLGMNEKKGIEGMSGIGQD